VILNWISIVGSCSLALHKLPKHKSPSAATLRPTHNTVLLWWCAEISGFVGLSRERNF